MTLITMQGGAVVMKDGQVGTGSGCCCSESPSCTCAQANITTCPESFDVTFEGIGAFDPACTQNFTYTITKNDVNGDGTPDGWQGGVTNFHSVVLYCNDGRWLLSISADNYPFDCPVIAGTAVDLGSVCNCPQTGVFNALDIYGNPTTVTVT